MYSESKRIEFLDSIRGLAALFVLLSHTIGAVDWAPVYFEVCGLPFVNIFFDGKEAVCMFFVLSGYVLSKPYVASTESPVPRKIFLPTFYLRRFTRIWIPWFFVFVASIFARKFLYFPLPPTTPPKSAWMGQFWQASLTAKDFFLQCAFMLHDSSRQLLNQDWSLGVELKGSLLIPLFLFLSHRKRLLLISIFAIFFLLFQGTGHYYVSFIIGVLLAQWGCVIIGRVSKFQFRAKVLFLLSGLLLYQGLSETVRIFDEYRPTYKCGWTITSIGCAVVLLSAFSSKRIQTVLNCKPIVFLGKISYSVYLIQFIVILCVLPVLLRLANHCGVTQPLLLFVFLLLASVGVTLALSAANYRFIEEPSIRFGHWLTKGIQRRLQH